jgi:hypothetical protein
MTEEWKDIIGFEGLYQISSIGNVKNIKRQRLLTPWIHHKGYPTVKLYYDNGQKYQTISVHILLCRAFNGERPLDKPLACHKNDIKTDNRTENLYWGEEKDNKKDAKLNGLQLGAKNAYRGKNPSSKYKGASWYKAYERWSSKIKCFGKQYFMGYFDSEIEAAKAYDKKAKELLGDKAKLNFPEIK